jgi:cob(I)alamin adenosyltransferase
MGFCACAIKSELGLNTQIEQIQNDLHLVAADLATPPDVTPKLGRLSGDRSQRLEAWIDSLDKTLEPLRNFVLPGGCELSARLHLARTVARRAEREVLRLSEEQAVNPEVVIYLNRLSDYLFVAARWANHQNKVEDVLWDQTK